MPLPGLNPDESWAMETRLERHFYPPGDGVHRFEGTTCLCQPRLERVDGDKSWRITHRKIGGPPMGEPESHA